MSDPFFGCCPDCGRNFSLLDLAVMAEGDGWVRRLALPPEGDARLTVRFGDFTVASAPDSLFAEGVTFSLGAHLVRQGDGTFRVIEAAA